MRIVELNSIILFFCQPVSNCIELAFADYRTYQRHLRGAKQKWYINLLTLLCLYAKMETFSISANDQRNTRVVKKDIP